MSQANTARQLQEAQAALFERRTWVRYPSSLATSCRPLSARRSEDAWCLAQVRDVSLGGIGLVLPRSFEPGVILTIDLPRTSPSFSPLLLARVVHATEQAPGEWIVGCEFANQLSPEDLRALVGDTLGRKIHPLAEG
jgi:hypothetical protein